MKATIKAGCGHWDITIYPMGGDFHRSAEAIELTEVREVNQGSRGSLIGQPSKLVIGKNAKGRTLAASVESCTVETCV